MSVQELKEKAKKHVNFFRGTRLPPQFPLLHRETIADQLLERIDDPQKIDQGSVGTCAPAVFIYGIARHQPLEYVKAVAALYDLGVGYIGRFRFQPSESCKKSPCPLRVAEADWIIMASIRDSANWVWSVNADNAVGNTPETGTNPSEIEDWFKKAAFKDVQRDTVFNQKVRLFDMEDNFKKALGLWRRDYHVVLWIRSELLKGKGEKGDLNHVVALAGDFVPPRSRSESVRIPVWSYGEEMTLPNTGAVTYQQFLDNYGGYVAANF